MSVGVFEVHAAATVAAVDFGNAVAARVGPVLEPSFAEAVEDLIEVVFADQEGVVLRGNLAVTLVEIE